MENVLEWGEAEKIIHRILSHEEDSWGQDGEVVCGLSIESQITKALREAGLLIDPFESPNPFVSPLIVAPLDPLTPPTDFEMYTDEGNEACRQVCLFVRDQVEQGLATDKLTLEELARPLVISVSKQHDEVYDTEPRNHIADYLDQICREKGWAYNEWDGYDLG